MVDVVDPPAWRFAIDQYEASRYDATATSAGTRSDPEQDTLACSQAGVVPWHSHGERPAIIYIIKGTIEEYASNCAVPIVHKAGDVTAETKDISHWWKNTGEETAVLISADLPKS